MRAAGALRGRGTRRGSHAGAALVADVEHNGHEEHWPLHDPLPLDAVPMIEMSSFRTPDDRSAAMRRRAAAPPR
jgi:hypothetical protein